MDAYWKIIEYRALSHPNRIPAAASITTFSAKMILKESTPFFSDKKIAIKSVPPVVAFTKRQTLITRPLIMPPKILISSISYVIVYPGTISVNTLVSTIIRQEYNVNFFPINRNPMYTGTAFSNRLTTEYGSSTFKNNCATRCIKIVSPVAPPGYNPPVRTNDLIFTAISKDARQMIKILFPSSFALNFIFETSTYSCQIIHRHLNFTNNVLMITSSYFLTLD